MLTENISSHGNKPANLSSNNSVACVADVVQPLTSVVLAAEPREPSAEAAKSPRKIRLPDNLAIFNAAHFSHFVKTNCSNQLEQWCNAKTTCINPRSPRGCATLPHMKRADVTIRQATKANNSAPIFCDFSDKIN